MMNPNSYFSNPGLPNFLSLRGHENNVLNRSLLQERGFWFNPNPTGTYENGVFGHEGSNSISTISPTPSTRCALQITCPPQASWIYPTFYPQPTPLITPSRPMLFSDMPRNLLHEATYVGVHLLEQLLRNGNFSNEHNVEANGFQPTNFNFRPYEQIAQGIPLEARCVTNEEIRGDPILHDSFPPREPFELPPAQVFDSNTTTGTLVPDCLKHGVFVFHPSMASLLSKSLDGCKVMVMDPWEFNGAPLCTCNLQSAQLAIGTLQRYLEIRDQRIENSLAANYLAGESGFQAPDLSMYSKNVSFQNMNTQESCPPQSESVQDLNVENSCTYTLNPQNIHRPNLCPISNNLDNLSMQNPNSDSFYQETFNPENINKQSLVVQENYSQKYIAPEPLNLHQQNNSLNLVPQETYPMNFPCQENVPINLVTRENNPQSIQCQEPNCNKMDSKTIPSSQVGALNLLVNRLASFNEELTSQYEERSKYSTQSEEESDESMQSEEESDESYQPEEETEVTTPSEDESEDSV